MIEYIGLGIGAVVFAYFGLAIWRGLGRDGDSTDNEARGGGPGHDGTP